MKWKCHFARKQISAYIDSALSDNRARSLEAHLVHCADCRLFLERARRLDDALLDLPQQHVPSDTAIAARLHHRISESRLQSVNPVRGVGSGRPFRNPVFAGFATAFVLTFGLLIGVFLGKEIAAPGLPMIEKPANHKLDRMAEAVMDVAGYQAAIVASPGMQKEGYR